MLRSDLLAGFRVNIPGNAGPHGFCAAPDFTWWLPLTSCGGRRPPRRGHRRRVVPCAPFRPGAATFLAGLGPRLGQRGCGSAASAEAVETSTRRGCRVTRPGRAAVRHATWSWRHRRGRGLVRRHHALWRCGGASAAGPGRRRTRHPTARWMRRHGRHFIESGQSTFERQSIPLVQALSAPLPLIRCGGGCRPLGAVRGIRGRACAAVSSEVGEVLVFNHPRAPGRSSRGGRRSQENSSTCT